LKKLEREFPIASLEADSPMLPDYRAALLRLLADQARAELYASTTYARWVPRVDGIEEKVYLAAIAHEETEHWARAVRLLEQLGVPPHEVRRVRTSSIFYALVWLRVPRKVWLDVVMMNFLIDHAAYYLVEDFAQSSYAPWARMAQEILQEEATHSDFGADCVRKAIQRQGQPSVSRALRRWWPIALNVFGPPTTARTPLYLRYGLKFRTNEERRQAYRAACEPKIRAVGLEVPPLHRNRYPFL
jgi:ring-1,2-phenylacetyl-CoA epoxidase subunit PaaA